MENVSQQNPRSLIYSKNCSHYSKTIKNILLVHLPMEITEIGQVVCL